MPGAGNPAVQVCPAFEDPSVVAVHEVGEKQLAEKSVIRVVGSDSLLTGLFFSALRICPSVRFGLLIGLIGVLVLNIFIVLGTSVSGAREQVGGQAIENGGVGLGNICHCFTKSRVMGGVVRDLGQRLLKSRTGVYCVEDTLQLFLDGGQSFFHAFL